MAIDSHAGLIDVAVPPPKPRPGRLFHSLRRWLILVLTGVSITAAVLLCAVLTGAPKTTVNLALVAFVVVGCALAWRQEWRLRRRQSAFEQLVGERGLPNAVQASGDTWLLGWLRTQSVCQRLARLGCVGHALRVSVHPPTPVEPLAFPFEARRLSDGDTDFDALAQATGTSPATTATVQSRRRIQRWLVGISVPFYAAMAILLAAKGHVVRGVPALLGMQLPLFAFLLLAAAQVPRWLIVPGGLIVRRIPLWGPIQLHLFKRATSVIVLTGRRYRWYIAVADAHASFMRPASVTEAEFLLRAWFSPLPPPSPEQLDGLR